MSTKPTYKELEQRVQELEQSESERKKTGELLWQQKKIFSLLVNYSSDILVLIDKNGEQKFISPSAEKITGYTVGELQRPFAEIIHPEDLHQVERGFEELLNNPEAVITVNYRHKHKDGGYRYFETVGRNFLDNPLVQGIVANVRDITERKGAEEELRKSEDRFRYLSDASMEAIFFTREGFCLEANQVATEMFGYDDPSEFIGMFGTEIIALESHEIVKENMLKNMLEPYEAVGERKDGTRFPIVIRAKEMPYKDKGIVRVTSIMDISDRKQAEDALYESEEKYKSLTNNLNVGVYRNSVGSKGKFIQANPAIVKMFGYDSREEFLKIGVSDLYKDPLEREEFIFKIAEAGSIKNEILELQKKDGTGFIGSVSAVAVMNNNGEIKHFDGIIEDITERKWAEESLRESHKRYQLIVENISNVVWTMDMNFNNTFVSPSVYQQRGYTPEEVKNQPLGERINPNSIEKVFNLYNEKLKLIEAGDSEGWEPIEFEIEQPCKDGSTIWTTNTVRFLPGPDKQPASLLGTTHDITERKRAEEALLESEAQKAAILDGITTNLAFVNEDLEILWANKISADSVKRNVDEMIGRKCYELWADPDAPCDGCPTVRAFQTKRTEQTIIHSPDGRVWEEKGEPVFDGKGGLIGVLEIAHDITIKTRAEDALRESEERYRLLVENQTDMIVKFDADGHLTFVSQSYCKAFGKSEDELLGKKFIPLIHDEDREAVVKALDRVHRPPYIAHVEERAMTKDGWRWQAWLNTAVLNEKNEVEATVAVGRDINKQKQVEEERIKLKAQLQQAQKMEAMGTLAGGIAHDFNNLLMAIQGRTSIMLIEKDSSHPDIRHLKGIEDNVESAADLTRQLLGFARGGKYEVSSTDLNELIEKQNRMFGRTKKEITIHGRYEEDLWSVEVDRGQIEQVLLNLYVNAGQAMLGGGDLHLETENLTLDENYVKPFSVEPGKYVKISVTDTGVGMDKATQERIFEPFFTTKEIGRGTGLGLASAYGIIKNHSGFINVYSEKGLGTTFNIYLPASEKEAIEEEKPAGDTLRGTETVLFVDDEDMIIEVAEGLFEQLGYRVLTAKNGKEAIEIYEENKEHIDIVLLDMIMPDMSGSDTYDKMKKIDPDIKVLLSSGYSINGQATEIMDRGCNGFIQKPFKMKELSQKLRGILDDKQARYAGISVNARFYNASGNLEYAQQCMQCFYEVAVMRKKPMKTILGYTINDTLYEGSQFVVYRGFSEGGKPVVLKVLRKEYPTTIEVARFQREFEIISEFHVEGVIQVFGIEHYKHTLVMVMEDFGGESLARLKERGSLQLNIFEFLNLAIQITNILDEIHRLEVIHKDINPANIIWNLETGQLKIIDFGDSTLLSEETVAYANPNLLNGTLPYISPEQTGRMNRLVDYRTDFYSLGVTLYELLTSQRPFISQDPLEVVYAHIAKMPVAPHQYSPEIPLTISDIVVKLMEKNAEDRYQSIYGLQYDLQECLTQFSQAGKVDKFRIGKKDYFEKFLIPQKLYGRQREIKTLLSAFERVSKGSTEMMLVAGYSGVGKSSLVSELHKPIVEKRGYFISGKFDQYKRNIPYAPFIEAFQNLTQQLLTETEDQIAEWKSLILAAVGHNGRVIIDLIPDVELIIGKQPLISELSPTESQNRFNYIFQNFVRVFASSDHPLTIFLDDLQWVDLSSLGLIELLLSGDQTKFLLLIGAYRDNEVEASHPLMISLDKLTRQNCLFSTLPLTPLDERDLTQFVADIIHEKPISARPLSQLCRQKTNGNPFFLKQFINTLYQQKLLKFDPDLKAWSWNLDAIKKENFSDNVVTLMVGKINDLPTNTRIALKIAAAIGMRFDLKLMSLLLEKPSRQVAVDLWEAIQAGYITSIDDKYKYSQIDTDIKGFAADAELQFTHDRIQQAAYSFNDEEQKPRIHLRIGMFLIETLSQEEQGDQIFDIVNHFNKGIELLTESQTKIEAARLNQIAGYRAISAMAGSAAAQYFQTGLHLLEEDCWEQHYSLTFELTCGLIESSYLLASYEKAEELCDTTLHQAQNQLDTVRIYDLMCYNFTLQNRMGQTLTTGLEALKILNISLVEHPPENIDIDRLRNLDQMVEPDKLAAMSILVKIISCALVTQSPLMMPLIYTMVNLSSRYGNSSKAPFGYVWFGCTLCWTRKDIGLGYQLGRLAMDVMEKFDARDVETTVRHQFNSFIRHWCEHERHSLNEFPHIVQIGKETGDVEYGTYVAVNYIANLLLVGEPLASAREKQQPFIDWVASTKFSFSETYGNIFAQAAQCLMGQGDSAWRLQGDFLDENKMIPEMKRTNNNLNLFAVYSAKVITAYFNGSFSETVDFARQTELYEASIGGLLPVTQVPFYGALALLRTISDGDCEWNDAIKTLENYEEKLNLWAEHGPMNFQHKYDLVKAEKARVSGRIIEAEAYYEQAVKGASENEYIHEEALAYELASEFYYNRGMMKFSQTYMREAHNCYRIWGANGKVKDLEERFPDFLSDMPTLKEASSEKNRRSSSSTGGNLSQLLDVSSLIKATRSLSAEVVLEELLKKMMHIMFENTGAQKGLLIMPHENEFIIEAEGSDDLNEINVLQPVRLAVKSSARQPASIIRYVARTRKTLMLDDAGSLGIFKDDPYILNNATKSILCAPIVHQNKLTGIIYLENNLATGVFTSDRLDIINILSAQAAISIENARLYATLEDKIAKRTEELQKAHDELEQRVEERTLELKEKQARLVHTSRLTALGELAAGVAHELGQPLQVIKSVSGLVHDEIKADTFNQKEILQFVNNLSNEVDRAAAIINNMRAFAGFGENNTEITSFIDIHISLMGSLAFFRAQFKKHQIELNLEIDDNLPKIQADSHKIQQVVVNLLSNARYAVDNKKPTAGGDKKKEVTIRLRQSIGKDQLVLEVKDNGIGMGEEEIHHCLEPFYTTKKPGEGTGLGLSITYGLVKEHGFKLEIESKRGEYSLFRIIMPINSRE